MRPWNQNVGWCPNMAEAPRDCDILATVVGASGQIRVCVVFYREQYDCWCTITGQRVSNGAMLAWMRLPAPYKVSASTPEAHHE